MEMTAINIQTSEHPLLTFVNSYDQWKEEHHMLKKRLTQLNRIVKWNPPNFQYTGWVGLLRETKMHFVAFMNELEHYLAKEEQSILPIAGPYADVEKGPVHILEQEHELINQFFQSFLDKAQLAVANNDEEEGRHAVNCMLQAMIIVSDHFRVEEEHIFPLTEQIMTEIEYYTL